MTWSIGGVVEPHDPPCEHVPGQNRSRDLAGSATLSKVTFRKNLKVIGDFRNKKNIKYLKERTIRIHRNEQIVERSRIY